MKNMLLSSILVPAALVALSGCPDIKTDAGEGPNDAPKTGPVVEFDPSKSIIPFPNNLILDAATGKVNLPAQCGETATALAMRTGVLNKLDGFGTYEVAMRATFTELQVEPGLRCRSPRVPENAMLDSNLLAGEEAHPLAIVVPTNAVADQHVAAAEPALVFDGSKVNPVAPRMFQRKTQHRNLAGPAERQGVTKLRLFIGSRNIVLLPHPKDGAIPPYRHVFDARTCE